MYSNYIYNLLVIYKKEYFSIKNKIRSLLFKVRCYLIMIPFLEKN